MIYPTSFLIIFGIYTKILKKLISGKKKIINNQVNGDAFAIIFGFLLEREKVKILKMDEELV